jgi:hypothetical protein
LVQTELLDVSTNGRFGRAGSGYEEGSAGTLAVDQVKGVKQTEEVLLLCEAAEITKP